jgi:hypothetical protein
LVLKVKNDPVEPIKRQRRNVPEGLIHIVEKAMAKEPSERFATAHLLANALEQVAMNLAQDNQLSGIDSQPESTTAQTLSESASAISEQSPLEPNTSKSTVIIRNRG